MLWSGCHGGDRSQADSLISASLASLNSSPSLPRHSVPRCPARRTLRFPRGLAAARRRSALLGAALAAVPAMSFRDLRSERGGAGPGRGSGGCRAQPAAPCRAQPAAPCRGGVPAAGGGTALHGRGSPPVASAVKAVSARTGCVRVVSAQGISLKTPVFTLACFLLK